MDASCLNNTIPFHRGLYCFGNHMNNFSLIFVRNLKAWPSNKIMMKIISKIQNYFEIILYIKKNFLPGMVHTLL